MMHWLQPSLTIMTSNHHKHAIIMLVDCNCFASKLVFVQSLIYSWCHTTLLHLNTTTNSPINKYIFSTTSFATTGITTKHVHQIIHHIKIHPVKSGHKWIHDPFLALVVLADPGSPGQVLESHRQSCACMSTSPIKPDRQNNINSPNCTRVY